MKPIFLDLTSEGVFGEIERDSLELTLLDDGDVVVLKVHLDYFPGTVTAAVPAAELLRLLELAEQAKVKHQVPFLEEPAPEAEGLEFDPAKPLAFEFQWWHPQEDPPIYLWVPIATDPRDNWAPAAVMVPRSQLIAALQDLAAVGQQPT